MLQAVETCSIHPLPLPTGYDAQKSRPLTNGQSAEIVDLTDWFVKAPATTLQEAKERILRELPPKPDFTGMGDFQIMEAVTNWNRMRLYVYQTVLFG